MGEWLFFGVLVGFHLGSRVGKLWVWGSGHVCYLLFVLWLVFWWAFLQDVDLF